MRFHLPFSSCDVPVSSRPPQEYFLYLEIIAQGLLVCMPAFLGFTLLSFVSVCSVQSAVQYTGKEISGKRGGGRGGGGGCI